MKRILLALTAAAALAGSAYAADLPRPYVKAPPPPVPVATWTGCYIGGGGGYGLWNQENKTFLEPPQVAVRTQATDIQTNGGRGYFGTVQGGCDYQFGLGAQQFVIGAFADGDWGSIKGKHNDIFAGGVADEKLSSSWSVGARIGWLAFPRLLTYFSAGYTEATFDRQNFTILVPAAPPFGVAAPFYMDKQTYHGWYIGAGDEYALNFLPGLFWKTEYRVAEYNTKANPFLSTVTSLPIGLSEDSHKWVQTVRSELVYRFNWDGPVVARY